MFDSLKWDYRDPSLHNAGAPCYFFASYSFRCRPFYHPVIDCDAVLVNSLAFTWLRPTCHALNRSSTTGHTGSAVGFPLGSFRMEKSRTWKGLVLATVIGGLMSVCLKVIENTWTQVSSTYLGHFLIPVDFRLFPILKVNLPKPSLLSSVIGPRCSLALICSSTSYSFRFMRGHSRSWPQPIGSQRWGNFHRDPLWAHLWSISHSLRELFYFPLCFPRAKTLIMAGHLVGWFE